VDVDSKLLEELKRLRVLLAQHYRMNIKRVALLDQLIAFGEGVVVGKSYTKAEAKKKETTKKKETAEQENEQKNDELEME